MRLQPTILALAFLSATSTQAAIFHSKAVKQLKGSNFMSTVQSSDKLTVAAFVAPWCGHCKALAPEYDKAAENLKGLVNVVAIDCDEDSNKSFCGGMDVKGFPTLKIFPGGSAPPQDYQGPRTAKGIVEHVTGRMPTFVKKVTSSSELEALRDKATKKPISLLFTSATLVTPLYKALSTDFRKTVDFYAARDVKVGEEAMRAFGVEKVPALVVLSGDKVEKYEGPLKYDKLRSFLEPFAKAAKSAKPAAAKLKEEL